MLITRYCFDSPDYCDNGANMIHLFSVHDDDEKVQLRELSRKSVCVPWWRNGAAISIYSQIEHAFLEKRTFQEKVAALLKQIATLQSEYTAFKIVCTSLSLQEQLGRTKCRGVEKRFSL